MGSKNVMPSLPNQNQQQPSPKRTPNNRNNKVNTKALIIIAIVSICIIVLIIIRGEARNTKSESDVSVAITTEQSASIPEPEYEETEPQVIEAKPEDNAGTELVDLLASGSVYFENNTYVLADDINYSAANSLADSTVISMDKNFTIMPSESCAYSYSFNSVNISHNSGSVLTVSRQKAADKNNMPTISEYTTSLETISKHNGIVNPVYGEVYVGSSKCGVYVRGTLKMNGDETDKTIIIMHFNGSPEVYSLAAIYDTQDSFSLMMNTIKLYGTSLKLN